MFSVHLLNRTLRSNFKPLKTRFFYNSTKKLAQHPIDINTNVIKDVILFKYENPRFYKILNIFAICQFGFWSYLSFTAFVTLRDAPVSKAEDAAWWRKINLGENKYRNVIGLSAFIIGTVKLYVKNSQIFRYIFFLRLWHSVNLLDVHVKIS